MAQKFSVQAILSAYDKNFGSTFQKAEGRLDSLAGKIKSGIGFGILTGIGQSAFQKISGSAAEMFNELSGSSAAWKTFAGNMRIAHGDTKETNDMIEHTSKELKKFAQDTIYSSSDMAQTFAQLDAVGTKNTLSLVKGFGGLAAAAENPTQAMKTLSQQATQMAAKPKVAWQDFKLMLEQTPAGIAAVAKEMNMSTSDLIKAVQDGNVETEKFFDAIQKVGTSDGFTKLATQYKTVGQAMDGLKETVANKMQPVFEKVSGKVIESISKVVDKIGDIDENALADKLQPFIDGIGKVIDWLGTNIPKAIEAAKPYLQVLADFVRDVGAAFKEAFQAIFDSSTDMDNATTGAEALRKVLEPLKTILIKIANFMQKHADVIGKIIDHLPAIIAGFAMFKGGLKAFNTVAGVANTIMGENGIFGKVKKVAGGIKTFAGGVKTAASKIKTFKDTVIDSYAVVAQYKIFKPMGSGLKKLGTNIGKATVATGKGVGKISVQIGKGVGKAATILGKGVGQMAITTGKGLANMGRLVGTGMARLGAFMLANPIFIVIAAIAALVIAFIYLWNHCEAFRNFWIGLWDGIKKIVGIVVDAVIGFFTQTIPSAIQTMISFFAQLPGKIWGFLTDVVGKVVSWVVNMVSKAAEVGLNFLQTIVNFFSQLPGKIWNFLVDVIGKIANWAGNIISKAAEAGANFLSAIWDFFSQLPGKIWGCLTDALAAVGNFVVDLAQKGWEAATGFGEKLLNGLQDLIHSMYEIGKNLIRGLWEGIQSMGGWIKDKVGSFFGGIGDKVKAVFGVHSPSRVFRNEIGRFLPMGLVDGVKDEMPRSFRVIEGALNKGINSLSTPNMSNIIPFPTTDTNIRTSTVASLDDNFNYNREAHYTINVPLEVNGREFAKATVKDNQEAAYDSHRQNKRKIM